MTPPDPRVLALEDERRVLHRRLEGLASDFAETVAASLDTNADDEHDPEGATIAFERSQVGALAAAARAHLAEIDAAEQRLAAGTYGVCERCREAIGGERLAVRPAARRCVRCAGRR